MRADIRGALVNINVSWKSFTHKGLPMTKNEVRKVLEYAMRSGYQHTGQLKDGEVDQVLSGVWEKIRITHKRVKLSDLSIGDKFKLSAYPGEFVKLNEQGVGNRNAYCESLRRYPKRNRAVYELLLKQDMGVYIIIK